MNKTLKLRKKSWTVIFCLILSFEFLYAKFLSFSILTFCSSSEYLELLFCLAQCVCLFMFICIAFPWYAVLFIVFTDFGCYLGIVVIFLPSFSYYNTLKKVSSDIKLLASETLAFLIFVNFHFMMKGVNTVLKCNKLLYRTNNFINTFAITCYI